MTMIEPDPTRQDRMIAEHAAALVGHLDAPGRPAFKLLGLMPVILDACDADPCFAADVVRKANRMRGTHGRLVHDPRLDGCRSKEDIDEAR